ncbi:MAG: hypothetical protein NC489_27960 [Ruminococcus flavefaciens]|nr:hypothetical protein [Ruminococcus flavefaciens]
MDLTLDDFKLDNGKANWDAIAKFIKDCDEIALSYFKTLEDGNGTINNQSASVEGLGEYLQATGQSFDFAAIKARLLNSVLNAGIMLAVSAAIKTIAAVWNAWNETIEESQAKVDDINSKLDDLNTELSELKDLQNKTEYDNSRIQQLESEIKLQERLLEIEQKRLYQNQIGTKFSDYFDADSLVSKKTSENNRYNKEGYEYLSNQYAKNEAELEKINNKIASLNNSLTIAESEAEKLDILESINDSTERRNKILNDQVKVEEQLTLNSADYLNNYQMAQDAVDSGLLTGEDLAKAKEMSEYWHQMYLDSSGIITNIQKENGTYEESISTKLQNSIRRLADDHGIADRNQIAELNEVTKDFTDSEIEVWLEATQGAKNATEAIQMYKAAISATEQELLNMNQQSSPISQTINQLNTQLKPAFDSLKSAYQDIFTDDGFTLENVDISMLDSIKSSLEEINDLEDVDINIDMGAFDDFASTLIDINTAVGTTEEKAQQAQQAFNDFATDIFYATDSTAGMTDETKELVAQLLESLGVVNATEVAEYALVEAKAQSVLASHDLADATIEEYTAILDEGVAAGITRQEIYALTAAEIAFGNNDLSVEQKIQKLNDLATAYGDTASAALATAIANDLASGHTDVDSAINDLMAKINAGVKKVDIDFPRLGKSSAKSAGKEAGDAYKEGLEDALSDLDSVISGITKSIDGQISSINEQKDAALDAIDAEIDALEEAKDAAIEAIEEERDARIKAIDDQISAKQKIIDGIQDEIDAMREANEQRQRELDLGKAKYELEKMQHQRVILQYSEEKGMHYVTDTQGITDAREKVKQIELEIEIANKEKEIDLLEKEIDLLETRKDEINEYYDELIEQTEKAYDAQIKALKKQRQETEKYYDSLIKNLESTKSKFEELTELLEKAELSAKLKQLGIDEEALLNGSEEEFNKLRDAYLNIVTQLNAGNDDVLEALRELSGYDGTAPALLSDSNTELDTMNGNLDTANQNVGTVNSSLDETATTTSNVASNVSDISTNLTEANTLVSEEQTAFDNLKQTIDEVLEVIDQKTEAIQNEQNAVGIATSSEMADFLLLKDKILEVKETLDTVNNTVATMDRQPIDNLTTAFQMLYNQLLLVSNILSVNAENSIASSIQALNEISLEDGIIAQFTNLKTAIDAVTAAISGGGESSGGEGQGGNSASGQGGASGGKGSESGSGGNSLTGAITEMGSTAQEVIGEPDAEGDGTVIGEFGSMETAVNDVRDAIGTEGSEGESGSGGESEDTLVGSIEYLGDKTEEELGESGGDGIIGRFEEFRDVIGEADAHVHSISDGLDAIDGKEVECTITVNIKTNGSIPAFASGTALGGMNLNSAEYNAKYTGNAHVEGTANVTGNWGVRKGGRSLVGELGQELWVHSKDGTFETVGDNGAEFINTEKGDLIFNHLQTRELLDKGNIVKNGRAYANGTVEYSDGTIITPAGQTLQRYDPDKDDSAFGKLYKAWHKYYDNIGKDVHEINEELSHHLLMERNEQMQRDIAQISNASSIVNNTRNVQQPITVQIGDINLTGVQDANGLAHAIKMQLPNAMLQEIHKN